MKSVDEQELPTNKKDYILGAPRYTKVYNDCEVIIMKNHFIVVLLVLIISPISADGGIISLGSPDITFYESGQNAIIAWDGTEEVLILSINAYSSESTAALKVVPLPSNPTVEEGTLDSFAEIGKMIREKGRKRIELPFIFPFSGAPADAMDSPRIEITLRRQIGPHDITVVKVNDLDYFLTWVDDFTVSNGFEYTGVSPEFKETISNYLEKDIKFFVFDVIDTDIEGMSMKPLIYTFETEYLFYPLEITATSDVSSSESAVNIYFLVKGIIQESRMRDINLYAGDGFDYFIELNEMELREISPVIVDLFDSAYVMNSYYRGPLEKLNEDLVIYESDIHIPTRSEKASQRMSQIIPGSLVIHYFLTILLMAVQYLFLTLLALLSLPLAANREVLIFAFYTCAKTFISISALLLFVKGVFQVTPFMAQSIETLLKRQRYEFFRKKEVAMILSLIIVGLMFLSPTWWLAAPVIAVFTGAPVVKFVREKGWKRYEWRRYKNPVKWSLELLSFGLFCYGIWIHNWVITIVSGVILGIVFLFVRKKTVQEQD